MSDWSIEFISNEPPSAMFLQKTLYTCVMNNARFDPRNFDAETTTLYFESGPPHERDLVPGLTNLSHDCTEQLPEVVAQYAEHDPTAVSIVVKITLPGINRGISVYFSPTDDGRTRLGLASGTSDLNRSTGFSTFIELATELFVRLPFAFGYSRPEDFPRLGFEDVNRLFGTDRDSPYFIEYMNADIVDQVGRDVLLTSPYEIIQTFHTGGILLQGAYNLTEFGSIENWETFIEYFADVSVDTEALRESLE